VEGLATLGSQRAQQRISRHGFLLWLAL
jgi:hypothetical protein